MRALTVADLVNEPVGGVDLVPVKHEILINTKHEVLLAQTKHNIARGLPELTGNVTRRLGKRTVSICGSAPSLMKNLHRLKGSVLAVNAAIPALHKAGVRLDYAMIWDGTPEMERYAMDIPGCTWLIASRVNPRVLDRLVGTGQDILLWHTGTLDADMRELLNGRQMVMGGGHGCTRAPFLMGALGYRDIHIFGADSSYASETHVGGQLRNEREMLCSFEGEVYRTTPWMMDQAEVWAKFVLPELVPTGMKFRVYGDGLLPAAHRSWVRQCLPWWRRPFWKT